MKDFIYKKSLGQNFLKDENIINKIVSSLNTNNDDLIIEIGPGSGALTKELIKKNSQLICIEIDKRLKEKLDSLNNDKIEIIYDDFLKLNLKELLNNYKYRDLYIVGNLPYYITTPIITKIIDEKIEVKEMVFMMQKEVGDRINAKPNSKEYNSLSIFLNYYFDISKVTNVKKTSFYPQPKVDSIVLKFKRHDKYKSNNETFFFKLIKDSFKQKRKNLNNNLKDYDRQRLEKILKEFNKDLTFRAEQLTIEEFIKISNNY